MQRRRLVVRMRMRRNERERERERERQADIQREIKRHRGCAGQLLAGRDFTVCRTSHECLSVPVQCPADAKHPLSREAFDACQDAVSIAATDRNALCVSGRHECHTEKHTASCTTVWRTCVRLHDTTTAIESSVVAMGGPSHAEANMGGPTTTKHGRVFESNAVRRLCVNPPLTVCISLCVVRKKIHGMLTDVTLRQQVDQPTSSKLFNYI